MIARPAASGISAGLKRARLKPKRLLPSAASSPLADTWNRIGGLFARLGHEAGIPPSASLAVWMVECGGLPFRRGKPVLRFEAHVFFDTWGKANEEKFDAHFQFGGRKGIEGARWQQHRFRLSEQHEWLPFHGEQSTEHQAFALAQRLGGLEMACLSTSFGGPQIMGFNHGLIGFTSAAEMFQAFARAERWQVCGFLDFCAAKGIVDTLKAQDWLAFANVYNGPGNASAYAAKIAEAHALADHMLGLPT